MNSEIKFSFGSEVYTWYMNNRGQTYKGKLRHMIEIISKSGFKGVQPIYSWMGDLVDPSLLKETLEEYNIKLAAISLALEWNGDKETPYEKEQADGAISLLKSFPGAILCTVQLPTSRQDIVKRRIRLVNTVNAVSARAQQNGVPCSFHPNSPHFSITRTEEDYSVILNALNPKLTGWTPDVGHIINAGMNPLEILKEYASLINLVHYKDWDGEPEFSLMGNGRVDLLSITKWLQTINYSGWIICEDEGKEALENPDEVTLHDGRWIREKLLPQLK